MSRKLTTTLAAIGLLALSGSAQAQCEDMRVIVRNSVYSIIGLEAFCTEFNKLKAEVAGMRSELSIARDENAMLRARLAAAGGQAPTGTAFLAGRGPDEDGTDR